MSQFKRGLDRFQKEVRLKPRNKGCFLVHDEIVSDPDVAQAIAETKVGVMHLFIKHTSAALTVNENYDRDVRTDMDMCLDHIVPESLNWAHVDEGPDDSASHTKSSLIGASATIPISNGRLALGTWQGVYLTEFRVGKRGRTIVVTVM